MPPPPYLLVGRLAPERPTNDHDNCVRECTLYAEWSNVKINFQTVPPQHIISLGPLSVTRLTRQSCGGRNSFGRRVLRRNSMRHRNGGRRRRNAAATRGRHVTRELRAAPGSIALLEALPRLPRSQI